MICYILPNQIIFVLDLNCINC